MKPVDFGEYLKSLRKEKKLTMRQLDLYSGVSHSYISQMERGERGIPSPEILKKLSKPLGVEYSDLMRNAGYVEEDNVKESEFTLPESVYEQMIKEAEEHYGVSLRDDPVVESAFREIVFSLAKMKKGVQ